MKWTQTTATMAPIEAVLIRYTRCIFYLYLFVTFSTYSVSATCYSDSSLRTEDKTSLVTVVVKARIQGRTEDGDLQVRVTKTLKGDPERLDKRDIIVTGLDAEGPVRFGTTNPVVRECMEKAKAKEKYVLFLQETEEEDVYSLQFDGVLNSKQELRVLRKVIQRENDSYNNTTTMATEPELEMTLPGTNSTSDTFPPSLKTSPHSTSTEHYIRCPRDGFCFNGGECGYFFKAKKYFCNCPRPWIGERCQVHDPWEVSDNNSGLFTGDMQTTLITLGIIFGALLLIAIICAVAYVKYKSSYYHDRRRQLEIQLADLHELSKNFEEAQPLNHTEDIHPHRTGSRHSSHGSHGSPETTVQFANSRTHSPSNSSHLLNSHHHQPQQQQQQQYPYHQQQQHQQLYHQPQQSRHYSLLTPVHPQPQQINPSLHKSRSDNTVSQTRTSIV